MARKTGYLASIDNVPPLIFRFQFNPDLLSEKKSFTYEEANNLGTWAFDKPAAGAAGALDVWKNIKELGASLVATKPLEAKGGKPRQISLDFSLDASRPGVMDDTDHYGGSIAPDLAVLRSFMLPSLDWSDAVTILRKKPFTWNHPPQCTLVYGGHSITCVMSDLNIKITAFQDDGSPQRADVSVTLQEQTYSATPLVEFVTRHVDIGRSYVRKGFGQDVLAVTPVLSLFE
jgi:contractile injection system tube protein